MGRALPTERKRTNALVGLVLSTSVMLSLASCSGPSSLDQGSAPAGKGAGQAVASPPPVAFVAGAGSSSSQREKEKARKEDRRPGTTDAGRKGKDAGDPMTDLWAATYDVEGSFTVDATFGSKTFEAPSTMASSYAPKPKTLLFYASSDPGISPRYGLGFSLLLNGSDAKSTRGLWIISPVREGGTVSYGFPTKEPLEWLDLDVGTSTFSITRNRSYIVSMTRESLTRWVVDIRPSEVRPPEEWFTSGEFVIEVSSPRPPWDSVHVQFSSSNPESTTTGELFLNRRKSKP